MYATEFGQDRWDEINRIETRQELRMAAVEGIARNDKYVAARNGPSRPCSATAS